MPENHFFSAVASVVGWTLFGILLATGALKLFDLITPGRLAEQVFKEHNLPAAMVYSAVFLGACLIVASAMH